MSDETLFLQTGAIVKIKGKSPKGESYELFPTGSSIPPEFISTVDGKVIEFKIKDQNNNYIAYRFVGFEHFLERDKKGYEFKAFGAFCSIIHYENYKNFSINFEQFIKDSNWYDSNFQYAENYDIVRFERIEFDDSTKYYSSKKYSLIYDDSLDFNSSQFPTTNVLSIDDTSENLLNTNSGKFFTKNIVIVNNNPYKKELTKLITLICFRIEMIHKDIFEIISRDTLNNIKQATFEKYNLNNSSSFDNLFKIDQIIGNLLKDWGFVDGIDAKYIFENKLISYIQSYYYSLVEFYNSLFKAKATTYFGYDSSGNPLDFDGNPITNDGIIDGGGQVGSATQAEKDKADDDRRIVNLIKYLTIEGIGVLEYDTRLEIVKQSLKLKSLPKNSDSLLTQNNLLKIVASFINDADANNFLSFLLQKVNGATVNFENLYYKIDDYIIDIDFPILGFSFGSKDRSRKLLVFILYKIWNFSFYDSNFIPSGTTPNQEGLNPNSYFLNDGKLYFVNAQGEAVTDKSLEFEGIENGQDVSFYLYDVDKNFYEERVKIIRGKRNQSNFYSENEEIKDLWYHLYQPILILGYRSIDDTENLYLPTIPSVPAFMFKYFKEYEEKYKTNALINLGVQVTTDILLLYFTAGSSQLLKIRYLKYLSESGQILLNPSLYNQASNIVKLWRIANTVENVSFVASTFANFATYMMTTTGNDEDKKFYAKMRTIAFLVMLGSGFGSLVAQRKAVKLADDLLFRLSQPGLTLVLNNSAKAFLTSLAQTDKYFDAIIGKIDAVITAYAPPGTVDNITPLFSTFTKEEKLGFYYDFVQMNDKTQWLKMNELVVGEAIAVKNWKKLYNLGAKDRTAFDVITSNFKTSAVEKFYADINLKKILEPLGYNDRWSVLNTLANVNTPTFNRIKSYPQSIEVFLKHTPQGKTLMGQNAEVWMKYYEARQLIKNQQWNELAQLFNISLPLEAPLTFSSLPNQRWLSDNPDFTETIAQGISAIIDDVNDVSAIANNLDVPENVVLIAKQNYFEKERIVLIEINGVKKLQIGRFTKTVHAYFSDLAQWTNAKNNHFPNLTGYKKEDMKSLLAHEYVESKLIDNYGVNYQSLNQLNEFETHSFGAHDIAPLEGVNGYVSLERLANPPAPNNNLSNLDEIVAWFVSFYKL